MTKRHEDMMIFPASKRRAYFRDQYAIELGRLHASGKCAWPIERLPEMLNRVMAGIDARNVPSGPAFDATMKFFEMKRQKDLFAFMDV